MRSRRQRKFSILASSTMSRRVRVFEDEFADWVGADHAVMVNSGSSANLLIVDALIRATFP